MNSHSLLLHLLLFFPLFSHTFGFPPAAGSLLLLIIRAGWSEFS